MKKYIYGILVLIGFLAVSTGVGIAIKNNAINNVDRNIVLLTKKINNTNKEIVNTKTMLKKVNEKKAFFDKKIAEKAQMIETLTEKMNETTLSIMNANDALKKITKNPHVDEIKKETTNVKKTEKKEKSLSDVAKQYEDNIMDLAFNTFFVMIFVFLGFILYQKMD